MKTAIASQPPSQNPQMPSPSPILEWGILLSAAIAGVGYFGKWILEQTSAKEKAESDLMRGLIANLQEVQSTLILDSKEAKLQLIEHIDLKDTMTRMSTLLKDDVGRALATQGALYSKALENQTRMEGKIDAILRQNDEIRELLKQLLEKNNHENSG